MGAAGSALLDFGAFPGTDTITLDVATVGVVTTSLVEAWIFPATTTDHSPDEHRLENLHVDAVWKVDGTITITGVSTAPVIGGNAYVNLYGKYNVGWVWN